MFGPIPESNTPMDVTTKEANKKRTGMKSPTDEEEVPEGDSKLVMALVRLALQHESERRAHANDDNVVFRRNSSGRQTNTRRQVLSSRRNKARTTPAIPTTRSQTRCLPSYCTAYIRPS